MEKEFRFIGSHSGELDGGRPVAPGEFTGLIDADLPHNKSLIEDGLLIEATAPEGEPEPPKLTGAELTNRAKELGIEGYSKMTAEELRAAVDNADAGINHDNEEVTD